MNTAAADSIRMIIAVHLGVKLSRIVDDARLRDLGADRLDCLELLMKVEDQLPGLQTNELIAEQIETVGDLKRALEDLEARPQQSALVD